MATQYADKQGFVTPALIDYYKRLALCGAGIVVVEAAVVSQEGRGWSRQLSASVPEAEKGLSELAGVILENGAIPVLQLHHAGRQALPPPEGHKTLAPSGIPCPVLNRPVRMMKSYEITEMISKFASAAVMATKAGFTGVELHGAHGYLLHQFVSPLTNKRDDEYMIDDRGISRFPLEVVRAIRSVLPDKVISYRISARDYLPGGLTLRSSTNFARALEGAGVDLISVSGGTYSSLHGPESLWGHSTPEAVFRADAREISEATSCSTGVTGKIQQPSTAFSIIDRSEAHFVGLGRMILRDRNWIFKAARQAGCCVNGETSAANDTPEFSDPVRPCLLCSRCKYHIRGCPDGASMPPGVPGRQ